MLYLLRNYLAALGPWYLIVLGALAVAAMLVAPKGLWGSFSERSGIQIFPLRRRFPGAPPRKS